jgi:hypothetical protein
LVSPSAISAIRFWRTCCATHFHLPHHFTPRLCSTEEQHGGYPARGAGYSQKVPTLVLFEKEKQADYLFNEPFSGQKPGPLAAGDLV